MEPSEFIDRFHTHRNFMYNERLMNGGQTVVLSTCSDDSELKKVNIDGWISSFKSSWLCLSMWALALLLILLLLSIMNGEKYWWESERTVNGGIKRMIRNTRNIVDNFNDGTFVIIIFEWWWTSDYRRSHKMYTYFGTLFGSFYVFAPPNSIISISDGHVSKIYIYITDHEQDDCELFLRILFHWLLNLRHRK